MTRAHMRRWRGLGLLTLISVLVALLPQVSFACAISDPSCFVHAPLYDQLLYTAGDLWKINRGALIVAHWLEDLRVWLIDSVMVNAFTALVQPVKFLFYLALVVAWFVFILSFMVQSVVDLRWVDLRRATRPMLVAVVVFAVGGQCIRQVEELRVVVGSLLQNVAGTTAATFQAPTLRAPTSDDLPADVSSPASIYAAPTACGTPARVSQALYLNDYAARYLWATADDIHCADAESLAQAFRTHYFTYDGISNEEEPQRRDALRAASAGVLRQITGLVLLFGTLVEQLLHLLFALALALVWIALLLSLVFAVFLPTEELFSRQIKNILTILRTSWIAAFVLGLGMALLEVASTSGSAMLLLVCDVGVIAICLWQAKQAVAMMTVATESLNMTTGGAIQATGGMVKGWATTAALVAGAVATGGAGAVVGQVGSTMLRRAGRSLGDNAVSQAAGRVMTNRVAEKIDSRVQDTRLAQDAELREAEAAWYERSYPVADGMAEKPNTAGQMPAAASEAAQETQQRTHALRVEATELRARVLDRQAERARQGRNFARADRLRQRAATLRGDAPRRAPDATGTAIAPDMDSTAMERALEQLYEAQDDPDAQRRILTETAAQAARRAQLRAVRNRALRDTQFDTAKAAIRDLRALDGDAGSTGRASSNTPADGLTRPARRLHVLRPTSPVLRDLNREIAALAEQIGALEDGALTAPTDEARDAAATQLAGLRSRLTAAQERRAALRPSSPELLAKALTTSGPLRDGQPVAVARTAQGLRVNGHAVTQTDMTNDGKRVLVTDGGRVTLAAADAAKVLALPSGQALRMPTLPTNAVETAPNASEAPVGTPAADAATNATTPSPTHGGVQANATGANQRSTTPTRTQPAGSARGRGRMPEADAPNGTVGATSARPPVPIRGGDAGQSLVGAPAVASAPVPAAVPAPAPGASMGVPAVAAPGATSAPAAPAASAPPVVAPVAPSVPGAPVAASVAAAVPVPAPATPVPEAAAPTAPAVAPVAAPMPTAPVAPMSSTRASSAPPVPPATQNMPASGTPAPVAAVPAPPMMPAEERRPPAQPARVMREPALPQVPDTRSPAATAPARPAPASTPVATPPQPWKRRARGNES